MTLIIGRVSRKYAIQVSDRLVTKGAKVHDAVAKKSILLISNQGIAAISFTGLAYIGKLPADQWIAQTICGVQLDTPSDMPALGFVETFGNKAFHQILISLSAELSAVFPTLQRPACNAFFEIVITGWQWGRRSQLRPVNISIGRDKASKVFIIKHGSRHLGKSVECSIAPAGNIKYFNKDQFHRRLVSATSISECQNICVETIREAANNTPLIGRDCISLVIPSITKYGATVTYIGEEYGATINNSETGEVISQLSVGYTPWVIGPGFIAPPSMMNGEAEMNVRGYAIRLRATEPTYPMIHSAQRRPNP